LNQFDARVQSFHATRNDRLAIEMGQNATEVSMQFLAQRLIAQEWPSGFGGEDGVDQNLRERLRHDGRMHEGGI
jgi:hypothetical protein